MRSKTIFSIFTLANITFGQLAFASVETTGINGINSSGLGLTGNGVDIGQVERTRPGDKSFDSTTGLTNSTIDPAGVFYTSLNFGTPSFAARTSPALSPCSKNRPTPKSVMASQDGTRTETLVATK